MVTQTQDAAHAGPSSLKPPASTFATASTNTITGTTTSASSKHAFVSFRDIYDHLELARHQRSPRELEAILRSRKDKFRRCARPFAPFNPASKAKIAAASVTLDDSTTIRLDDQQRDLCDRISDRYDLDHLDALVLLRTFLESEDRSLELLVRPNADAAATAGGVSRASIAPSSGRAASTLGASAKPRAGRAGSDDLVSDFLDAFNVFYFEERLYVLRTTGSLFRIAEDDSHELYDLACDALALFADEAFGIECLEQFEAMAAEALPQLVRDQPRYSSFWAKQKLKEQMGLLEVVFLLFYGRVQASPAFIVRLLQSLQTTDVGRQQANVGFFDNEAAELVICIGHLLVLIAVESLGLEEAMDGIDLVKNGGQNKLVDDAAKLGEALDLLEQTGQDPSRSPILLAWSLVLNRVDDALAAAQEQLEAHAAVDQPLPPRLASLAETLRTDDGGPPVWRRLAQAAFAPELRLFDSMIAILSSPLLTTSNGTAVLAVSAPSALAYRAVFKGLLLSITELVKPEFLPNLDALIALWEAAFGSGVATELSPTALEGIAALCVQFWEVDSHYDSRCATVDTARRRWPVSFRPLLRLIKALTGNARVDALGAWPSSLHIGARSSAVEQACGSAFQFLAQLPTFAHVLPQGAAAALGTPYEMLDRGDFASVSYRVSRTVQIAGTHVRLPAGTTGSSISEIGATPVIVLWTPPRPISAWKLMRDILVGFPPYLVGGAGADDIDARVFDESQLVADFGKLAPADADEPWEEIAAEALELFSSVLSASPKLAWALLSHLDGDDNPLLGDAAMDVTDAEAGFGAAPGQHGRSKDLAAIAVHLLQHALVGAPINARLVEAGYKLLSILLPYMPNEIWQTIRSSNVLFGSPGSLSYTSSFRRGGGGSDGLLDGTGTTSASVLLAHETSRASYVGLLSLLDFLTALVLEMQRSHFVSAGELLQVKATVLTRGLAWVFESVWLEYQSWRYTKLREKLEIGRRCTTLFHLVLSETSWKVASLPSAEGFDQRGPASSLVEALERALVTHPSMLFVAPLVSALGSGQQLIDQLHRAGRQTDAVLAEDYVLASLQLARLMVSRRRDLAAAAIAAASTKPAAGPIRVELGLLERLFFDHAAVATRSVSGGGRKSARIELASAVMAYVLLPISSGLSAEAAKLITAVCRSTADVASYGQPVPGLVGHLGTIAELEQTMAGLVDLVGNTYLDASLRADVWTMLSAIIDTQPALATLLLTGRHLAKTTEFQLTDATASGDGKDGDSKNRALPIVSSSYGQALERTMLEVASDAVLIGQELLHSDPALLESILRFLDTAWAHASEHVAAFEPVRSKTAFFKALGDLATAKADVPPGLPEGYVVEDGRRRTDSDVEAREYAHRRMCQARALRLLEQDVQLGGGASSASLDTLLALLTDGERLRTALEACFKTHCDPALQYESERKLAELFPTVNLAALRHPARRDDFDVTRQYGDDYVYDTVSLRRKLEGFYETLSDDDVDDLDALEEGVLTVASINLEWTTLDVQATCIRAWTQCIQTSMGRLVMAATAARKVERLETALVEAFVACASVAVDETLEGDVMRGIHAARVDLLSIVIETAYGRQQQQQQQQGGDERLVEVAELASRLLAHPRFSVEESIQGLATPAFHRGCFSIALFCAMRCRRWLQRQQQSQQHLQPKSKPQPSDGNKKAAPAAEEAHRSLHRIMDGFAQHTIQSLALTLRNCLGCLSRSEEASESARRLEDDLDLLVAVFEIVIRDDVGLAPHAWLAQAQSWRLLESAIDVLGRAPVLRLETARSSATTWYHDSAHHPLFLTPVLSLLLALSVQAMSSEALALAGVVNGLTDNMLTGALEAGGVRPTLVSGQPNPTHECWCTMLRIVVAVVENLGGQERKWMGVRQRFVETDVKGFTSVYRRQMERALAAAASLKPTTGMAAAAVEEPDTPMATTAAGYEINVSGLFEEVSLVSRLNCTLVACGAPYAAPVGATAAMLPSVVELLLHPKRLETLESPHNGGGGGSTLSSKLRTIVTATTLALVQHPHPEEYIEASTHQTRGRASVATILDAVTALTESLSSKREVGQGEIVALQAAAVLLTRVKEDAWWRIEAGRDEAVATLRAAAEAVGRAERTGRTGNWTEQGEKGQGREREEGRSASDTVAAVVRWVESR
ncbi:hypothetical protein ACQY0O_002039 [Thecaphora frezii]